jgi:hypothetical protein
MSRWAKRAGKLSMAAARGGRRLQQAGRAADEADAARGPRPALEESDVDTKLTPGQGALLLRYLAGQLVLGRLEMIFLLKCTSRMYFSWCSDDWK